MVQRYREVLASRGEGYHHACRRVADFDVAVADLLGEGFEIAFSGDVVGLGRCVYMDMRDRCGPFVEILDMTPDFVAFWEALEQASEGWDGRQLLIPFPQ